MKQPMTAKTADPIEMTLSQMEVLHMNRFCGDPGFPFDESTIERYINEELIACRTCGQFVDLWDCVVKQVMLKDPTYAFCLLNVSFGAARRHGPVGELSQFRVGADSPVKVAFTRFTDVTEGVEIAFTLINCNPNEIRFGFLKKGINVPIHADARMDVFIIPDFGSDLRRQQMLDATRAFVEGRHRDMIFPANLLIEIGMNKISDLILSKLKVGNVDGFLQKTLTTSHQVNKFLPVVCELVGFPHIPSSVKGGLNLLKESRDEIIHTGSVHSKGAKTPEQFAKALSAAIIGYHYLTLLEKKVEEWAGQYDLKQNLLDEKQLERDRLKEVNRRKQQIRPDDGS